MGNTDEDEQKCLSRPAGLSRFGGSGPSAAGWRDCNILNGGTERFQPVFAFRLLGGGLPLRMPRERPTLSV